MDPEDPRALKMTPKLAIKGSIVTVLPGKKKKWKKLTSLNLMTAHEITNYENKVK